MDRRLLIYLFLCGGLFSSNFVCATDVCLESEEKQEIDNWCQEYSEWVNQQKALVAKGDYVALEMLQRYFSRIHCYDFFDDRFAIEQIQKIGADYSIKFFVLAYGQDGEFLHSIKDKSRIKRLSGIVESLMESTEEAVVQNWLAELKNAFEKKIRNFIIGSRVSIVDFPNAYDVHTFYFGE